MESRVVLHVKVEPLVLQTEAGEIICRWKGTCAELPGWQSHFTCESEQKALEHAENAACLMRSNWKNHVELTRRLDMEREYEWLIEQEDREKKS